MCRLCEADGEAALLDDEREGERVFENSEDFEGVPERNDDFEENKKLSVVEDKEDLERVPERNDDFEENEKLSVVEVKDDSEPGKN